MFSIRLNRPMWAEYFFARTIEKLSQFGIEQYYSVISNSKPGNELMPFYCNGSLSIKFVSQSTNSVQYLQFLSYQINLNWDNNHNHTAGWALNTTLNRFFNILIRIVDSINSGELNKKNHCDTKTLRLHIDNWFFANIDVMFVPNHPRRCTV